jgi:cell fate regulator YaaT (PSP1 superfamily)
MTEPEETVESVAAEASFATEGDVGTEATLAPETAVATEAPGPTQLIEVTFKGNRREFFTWAFPELPLLRTPIIVDADRGEDLGTVNATGELAELRKAGTTHGKASPDQLRPALRIATDDDITKGAQLRADEDNVRRRAIEKVRAQGLEMKVSDTEWQWDRKKLTIYFTAEKRVDFRQLVRQLEGLFGTRVQMWHIGVRDEAKRLDGIGRCARQFCSASWLPELRPVKSSVAKDQRLSTLNPSQISGSCGRLMCCLRYEHEFYVQQRKRFPKEGKIVVTLAGEEKIVSNDIFREQVTLRGATGEVRIVPLAQLNRELGGEPVTAASDLGGLDEDTDFDEEVTSEIYLVDPPRGADTRTYPGAVERAEDRRPRTEDRGPKSEDRKPKTEDRGRRPDQQRQQQQQRPQQQKQQHQQQHQQQPQQQARPQQQQQPRPPQPQSQQRAPSDERAPEANAEQSGEGGRRRRRRGRRGGRRGRDGGGPQSGSAGGRPGAPQSPTAPPVPPSES